MSKQQLVDLIVEQVLAREKLNKRILELEQEVERLKISRDLDSKTSSKPPSGDILKKSEKKTLVRETQKNRRMGIVQLQNGHLS
ncbi:MAG: DUF6444 domain-containing protein [Heteroscytonema crispum UTEX LB 1556]